jgi:cell division septation protein DedD
MTLQRRLQRFWPAALVTPEAGRYWIQVTAFARPYRARAAARRLRAQGFPVRTVLQYRL